LTVFRFDLGPFVVSFWSVFGPAWTFQSHGMARATHWVYTRMRFGHPCGHVGSSTFVWLVGHRSLFRLVALFMHISPLNNARVVGGS
jgi:hypothetical protein